jgi:hypothetical protein
VRFADGKKGVQPIEVVRLFCYPDTKELFKMAYFTKSPHIFALF